MKQQDNVRTQVIRESSSPSANKQSAPVVNSTRQTVQHSEADKDHKKECKIHPSDKTATGKEVRNEVKAFSGIRWDFHGDYQFASVPVYRDR